MMLMSRAYCLSCWSSYWAGVCHPRSVSVRWTVRVGELTAALFWNWWAPRFRIECPAFRTGKIPFQANHHSLVLCRSSMSATTMTFRRNLHYCIRLPFLIVTTLFGVAAPFPNRPVRGGSHLLRLYLIHLYILMWVAFVWQAELSPVIVYAN